jgi:hypothetical protein
MPGDIGNIWYVNTELKPYFHLNSLPYGLIKGGFDNINAAITSYNTEKASYDTLAATYVTKAKTEYVRKRDLYKATFLVKDPLP